MPSIVNLIPEKLHPTTGEYLAPTRVTTWRDGSTMTDARCGGLYNKDSVGYYKWNSSGGYPVSRLVVFSEANFVKLLSDFGTTSQYIIIDKLIPITANRTLAANFQFLVLPGCGFDISTGVNLTINGTIDAPSTQIFFGLGNVVGGRLTFPKGINAMWFGAKGDAVNDDGPMIQKAMVTATSQKLNVILPAGTYKTSVGLSVPQGVTLKGAGWLSTYLHATAAIDLVTTTSTSTVEDLFLQGGLVANKGLVLGGGNRTSIYRLKIEKFLQNGVHALVLNNSLIEEVMVQYCGEANFRLSGTLNCTFLSCNSNSDELIVGGVDTRSILIDYARNCRFIGGIQERGTNQYQVEVITCDDVEFANMEINNGATACAIVRGGNVSFNHMEFSTPANAVNVLAITGGEADIKDCGTSGSNGRGNPQLYKGNCTFHGSSIMPIMTTRQGGGFSGSAIGGALVAFDEAKRNILVTTIGATAQGVGFGLGTAGAMSPGQILRARIVVKNLSTGLPLHLYSAVATGQRIFVGPLKAGYNEYHITATGRQTPRIEILDGENVDKTFEISLIELDLLASDISQDDSIPNRRLLFSDDIEDAITNGSLNAATSNAVYDALQLKQGTLVSGTSIKTVNGASLLGAGDVTIPVGDVTLAGVQTLTNKTISGSANTLSNIPQSAVVSLSSDLAGKQATLVSGTNLKTINGVSLLGSGDISISGGSSVAGSNTQIQFNNSGVLGASSSLTWNGTSLGAPGLLTPGTTLTLKQTGATFGESGLLLLNQAGSAGGVFYNNGLDLVDMGFKGSSAAQYNLRYEHRTTEFVDSANTEGEFQFLSNSGTVKNQSFGNASSWINKLKLGSAGAASEVLDVTGNIKASSMAGTGDRMVVASSTGVLSTQAIPSGGGSGDVTLAGVQTLTNKTMSGASNTFSNIPQSAVTSLTTDLAAKAPTASPTFTTSITSPMIYGSTVSGGILTLRSTSNATLGRIFVTGALSTATTTNTSTSLTLSNSHGTVLCNTASGNQTLNLPTATNASGVKYIVQKISSDANTVTIDPNSAELIGGASTFVLGSQWDVVEFQSNGSAWYVVSKNIYVAPATLPIVESYQWFPSNLQEGTNCTQITYKGGSYMRVGNQVHCFFSIQLVVNSPSVGTSFYCGLPEFTDLQSADSVMGSFTTTTNNPGHISADTTSDKVYFQFLSSLAATVTCKGSFSYTIV